MPEPISWEIKRCLIKAAEAERTRCMQAFFAAGFSILWRSIRRLTAAFWFQSFAPVETLDRHRHVDPS